MMAQQPPTPETVSGQIHPAAVGCIFFNCGAQRWGVRLDAIQRILPASEINAELLPSVPRWILGAFQLNAVIATCIDLESLLLGVVPRAEYQRSNQMILIMSFEDEVYGCLVHDLSSTVMLDPADLQPLSQLARPHDQPYLLARYLPHGQQDQSIGAAIGLLDMNLLLTEQIGVLEAIGAIA